MTPQRRRRVAATMLCTLLVTACGSSSPGASTPGPESTAGPVSPSSAVSASTTPTSVVRSTTTSSPSGPSGPSIDQACLDRAPIRNKVAQLLSPAVRGADLAGRSASFVEWKVGGASLMSQPLSTTDGSLVRFKDAPHVPLLVSTDEEGGTVQRLTNLGRLPSQRAVAASMSAAEAERQIAAHAVLVRQLGIDVVWGPVVDVDPAGATSVLGSRVFSDDPATVTEYAAAYIKGWKSAGIIPTMKHFPGHGSATRNTDEGTGVTPPLSQLLTRDIKPYEALRQPGVAVMVGNLEVPGLTDQPGPIEPASLDRHAVTDVLRGQLGYADSLVFSDSLDARAITQDHSLPDAAERSIEAGIDIAVYTSTDQTPAILDRLVAAVAAGRLSVDQVDASVTRVLAAKHLTPCAL